jgi:hypothetical protein
LTHTLQNNILTKLKKQEGVDEENKEVDENSDSEDEND